MAKRKQPEIPNAIYKKPVKFRLMCTNCIYPDETKLTVVGHGTKIHIICIKCGAEEFI